MRLYIRRLTPELVTAALREHGVRDECVRTVMLSVTMLRAVLSHWPSATLQDVAVLMCRRDDDTPSVFEQLVDKANGPATTTARRHRHVTKIEGGGGVGDRLLRRRLEDEIVAYIGSRPPPVASTPATDSQEEGGDHENGHGDKGVDHGDGGVGDVDDDGDIDNGNDVIDYNNANTDEDSS